MAKQNMRDACAKDMLEFKCFGGPEKWLMKKLVIADHMKQRFITKWNGMRDTNFENAEVWLVG